MNTTFIRIGQLYINVAHIIDIVVRSDIVRITTTELAQEAVGTEDWIATNVQLDFAVDSDEAEAIISWADRQSESLV